MQVEKSYPPVCNDYKDIDLEVKTESATSTIQCAWLRIYGEEYGEYYYSCDAHAVIYYSEINRIRLNNKEVSPENYTSFIDEDKVAWKIITRQEYNNIPYPPGLQFALKKQ